MTGSLPSGSGSERPEAVLIACAQRGDVEAFEMLVRGHADRLYAVLLRLLGDRVEAEDVAQETMLRAWRGIGRFQGRSLFFTWLYRIAVNEANRCLEKKTKRSPNVLTEQEGWDAPAPASDEPSSRAEQRELRAALDRALSELSPTYATAIVLRDVEGLSTIQAAEIVGIGEAAFKSRLHQARLKVRAALGDEAIIAAGD
jgi:RNA polymerase sigma-70 factor (ECF subfamily)